MSKFRWDGLNLVNGEFVRSTELTTTYIPDWIVVTLPFFVLLPFVIGLCYFIALSAAKVRTNWRELNNKIFLLLLFSAVVLFGSIFSIIVLNSTLYNGWRQVYFLYPEIIVFAVFGIKRLIQSQNTISKYFSRIVFLFCTANAIWSGLFIINNHPYQNVYFNALAKQPLKDNYDLDYWGGATHLALEHLLKLKNGPVFYCNESAIPDTGKFLFSSNELSRLKQVPCDLAKYRINNFTAFSKDNIRLRNLEGNRVKSFYVDGDQVFLEILEGYRPFEESLKSLISTDHVEQTASFKDLKANLDQISVDSVDFTDQKHKVIDVKGWFFDKAITTSDQSYRVIVLTNNSDTVIVRVRDDFRPDVGNHFGDSNLYNCGFKTLIDMRDLAGKWDLHYGVMDHNLLYKSDKVTEVNL